MNRGSKQIRRAEEAQADGHGSCTHPLWTPCDKDGTPIRPTPERWPIATWRCVLCGAYRGVVAEAGSLPARVLVVNADGETAVPIVAALLKEGYDVRWEVDSLAGLAAAEEWAPALVVLDWGLPLVTAPVVLSALRGALAEPPPVVALGAAETTGPAPACGVAVVAAPSDTARLVRLVKRVLADAARPSASCPGGDSIESPSQSDGL